MDQIEQYLKALMYIAVADNEISSEELTVFSEIAVANGLPDSAAEIIKAEIESGKVDINAALADITEDKMKEKLVRDLLTMCYADDNYSIAEQNGMRDICNAIGVGTKKLGQLERESKMASAMHKMTGTVKDAIAVGAAGAVALGKKAIDGGNGIVHAVADGLNTVGSKISFTLESAKKAKEENKELREQLKKTTLTEAIKQKVIMQLGAKIANLSEQLQVEKKRNKQNEEMIQALQAQLEDLMVTMEVAQNAKTA